MVQTGRNVIGRLLIWSLGLKLHHHRPDHALGSSTVSIRPLQPSGEEGLALLHPEEVQGFGLALLPPVDPPQAQDVEQDGQQHHQDAEGQQVVVVDEGGAQPAGVALPQRLLLQVPAHNNNKLALAQARRHGEACAMPRPPERQEAGLEEDGPQGPLDLLVVDQLGRSQTAVVGGEAEP